MKMMVESINQYKAFIPFPLFFTSLPEANARQHLIDVR